MLWDMLIKHFCTPKEQNLHSYHKRGLNYSVLCLLIKVIFIKIVWIENLLGHIITGGNDKDFSLNSITPLKQYDVSLVDVPKRIIFHEWQYECYAINIIRDCVYKGVANPNLFNLVMSVYTGRGTKIFGARGQF